jgi:hypothetical protein
MVKKEVVRQLLAILVVIVACSVYIDRSIEPNPSLRDRLESSLAKEVATRAVKLIDIKFFQTEDKKKKKKGTGKK